MLQLILAKEGHARHSVSQICILPTQGKSLQAVFGKPKLNACVLVFSTQERYLTSKLLSHKVPNSSHPRWNFVQEMTHQICLAWITTNSNYRITSWACFVWWNCGGQSRRGQTCQSQQFLPLRRSVNLSVRESGEKRHQNQPRHSSSQAMIQGDLDPWSWNTSSEVTFQLIIFLCQCTPRVLKLVVTVWHSVECVKNSLQSDCPL